MTCSIFFSWSLRFLLVCFFVSTLFPKPTLGNFYNDIKVTWGYDKVMFLDNGDTLKFALDNSSGSAFITYNEYLYGKFDIRIKFVPGNSAGTVTTYYLSALGATHDEIDFEFLGNVSGQPYTVHTNVFTMGKGDKEQQFYLWFDPTLDYHTYTILWNPKNIIWMVDGIPIRVFKNNLASGVGYPTQQPMKVYASLWCGDDWATQGGRIKCDWPHAPFNAYYNKFVPDACPVYNGVPKCTSYNWYNVELNPWGKDKMKWVQDNYMIYNYCKDYPRFPQGIAKECSLPI